MEFYAYVLFFLCLHELTEFSIHLMSFVLRVNSLASECIYIYICVCVCVCVCVYVCVQQDLALNNL